MNRIRRISLLAVVVGLAMSVVSVQAAVSKTSLNTTNTIVKNGTTSVNLGNVAQCDNSADVALELRAENAAGDTGNITVTLARSGDGVNFETSPRFTWVFAVAAAQASNVQQFFWTNIPSSTLGPAHSVKVISIANANVNSDLTNCVLSVVKKRLTATR